MLINVCIFDDNRDIRVSLQLLLDGTDGIYVTGAFANANNLLEDINSSNPDIVLMDIGMDGINGIEAVRRIKKINPGIIIIMQTVFEDEEKIFSSILAGASGYLTKDILPLEIIKAIKDAYLGTTPVTPSIATKIFKQFQIQFSNEEYNLTKKEADVLRRLSDGLSYKMIANDMNITHATVHTHIRSVYRKLHVSSMGEAISKAIRKRII